MEILRIFKNTKYQIELRKTEAGLVLWRKCLRSGVTNTVDRYTHFEGAGIFRVAPLSEKAAGLIFEKLEGNEDFASCLILHSNVDAPSGLVKEKLKTKSVMEDKFTSTGSKLRFHQESLKSFLSGKGFSVVSTHISPEGRCNLACPYCSVSQRHLHNRINLSTIQKYVLNLKSRGLKAVILTGGGEPTLYPQFNELLEFLFSENLKVALITNGTRLRDVEFSLLQRLSWVRISINIFQNWQNIIQVPSGLAKFTTLGMSFIVTDQHEKPDFEILKVLDEIRHLVDKTGARYVRLLPNCLLSKENLLLEHVRLAKILEEFCDSRFFHQGKIHETPNSEICHQSFFRPYLSEEPFPGSEECGSVFPCDSIVLNKAIGHFGEKFVLCKPEHILEYMDRKIPPKFVPREDCEQCVFTSTVNLLEQFKQGDLSLLEAPSGKEPEHVEFI
jgi:organic radical activating enzyme